MSSSTIPPHRQRAAHMRAVLILFASVFAAFVIVVAAFGLRLQSAERLTLVSDATVAAPEDILDDKKETAPVQSVFAPNLVTLLGTNVDDALVAIGGGAKVTQTQTIYDKKGVQYTECTVPLVGQWADTYTGTPTVYLTLDSKYTVVEAGFKAGLSYLGYARASFTDVVENGHVVEKTLQEAGLFVELGTVSAPDDRSSYATYASDGVTLTYEKCEFTGTADGHAWRAVLTFDYTVANQTGNLANTIRTIAIYISA